MRSLLLNSAELQCVCACAYARDFVFCGRFFVISILVNPGCGRAGAAGVCVLFTHTFCARNIDVMSDVWEVGSARVRDPPTPAVRRPRGYARAGRGLALDTGCWSLRGPS